MRAVLFKVVPEERTRNNQFKLAESLMAAGMQSTAQDAAATLPSEAALSSFFQFPSPQTASFFLPPRLPRPVVLPPWHFIQSSFWRPHLPEVHSLFRVKRQGSSHPIRNMANVVKSSRCVLCWKCEIPYQGPVVRFKLTLHVSWMECRKSVPHPHPQRMKFYGKYLKRQARIFALKEKWRKKKS